jgi:predicted alpha/beta superfamily hydrolase
MTCSNIFKVQQYLVIFVILFSSFVYSQELKDINKIQPIFPEVSIMSTEKRTLHSNIIDEDFEIYVSLPYMYFQSDTTYPVLYLLDANIKFGLVSTMVNILGALTKELPEIVVVGIAYPIKGLEDWVSGRNRDFTPTKDSETEQYWVNRLSKLTGRDDIIIETGTAEQFLVFIKDELIPFIESNYRVSDKDRALHGTSLGGLFTIYAFFQEPALFQRYIAGSPSINWNESYMYSLEEEYANTHKDLPVRLYMYVGGLETDKYKSHHKKLSDLLISRTYPNLELKAPVFENETHGTSLSASLGQGLKYIYKK